MTLAPKIRPPKITAPQVGPIELGANELGANELDTNEIGTNEIGTIELDAIEMGTIEISYGCTRRGIPAGAQFRRWCVAVLRQQARPGGLSLRFVDAAQARALNHQYRAKDYATNVLSFPAPANPAQWLGDLVLWIAGVVAAVAIVILGLRLVPGMVSRVSVGFVQSAHRALFARDVWVWQVGLSLLIVACNLASLAFCAAATGTVLPMAAVFTVLPLVLSAMLIPVSVGGWGLREGAAAAIWPVLGARAEAGIAASIVFGIVILVATLPGLWVLLRRMRRDPGDL